MYDAAFERPVVTLHRRWNVILTEPVLTILEAALFGVIFSSTQIRNPVQLDCAAVSWRRCKLNFAKARRRSHGETAFNGHVA